MGRVGSWGPGFFFARFARHANNDSKAEKVMADWGSKMMRMMVQLTPEQKAALEKIARQRQVSVARLVHESVAEYVAAAAFCPECGGHCLPRRANRAS